MEFELEVEAAAAFPPIRFHSAYAVANNCTPTLRHSSGQFYFLLTSSSGPPAATITYACVAQHATRMNQLRAFAQRRSCLFLCST